MSDTNRLRMSLLIMYIIFTTWSAYKATYAVIDYCQCTEDENGTWHRFLVWIDLIENTPKCSSSSTLAMDIGWDIFLLMVVVVVCEAGIFIWKIFTAHAPNEELEPTEELYLMKHALRSTGNVIIIRVTKTKEEVIHLDPQTRKFRRLMVFPWATEDEGFVFN